MHCIALRIALRCVASRCCVRITSTLRIVGTEVRTSESVSLWGDAVTSASDTYSALATVGRVGEETGDRMQVSIMTPPPACGD